MRMNSQLVAVLLLLATPVADVAAQRAGQSISVQYGVVSGGRAVDLQSAAVPAGAVVGGITQTLMPRSSGLASRLGGQIHILHDLSMSLIWIKRWQKFRHWSTTPHPA